MNKIKKHLLKSFVLLILFFFFMFFSALSYSTAIANNLSDSVLRLHIIANSDSDEDQLLKLKVRDNILDYMKAISLNTSTKSDAIDLAYAHLDDFRSIAQNIVVEEGYNYPVDVSISNCFFPTKNYGDISLPAGNYDALRIQIGDSSGQNWWCVLFPPLCFVDISSGIVPADSKEYLTESLEDEEYELITANKSDDYEPVIKFKIVEFVEQVKTHL